MGASGGERRGDSEAGREAAGIGEGRGGSPGSDARAPRLPPLADAHCHLQDARIEGLAGELRAASAAGVRWAVVNGTGPGDWDAVERLCREGAGEGKGTWPDPTLVPSFGLHPWAVSRVAGCGEPLPCVGEGEEPLGLPGVRPGAPEVGDQGDPSSPAPTWLSELRARLLKDPRSCVGETGLDGGPGHAPMGAQLEALRAHLELARELGRPVTLHAVRCLPQLLEVLSKEPWRIPVVLHSWQQSAETTRQFATIQGTMFSLAPRVLAGAPRKVLPMVRAIPRGRLLLESDAPDGGGTIGEAWFDALPGLRAVLTERRQGDEDEPRPGGARGAEQPHARSPGGGDPTASSDPLAPGLPSLVSARIRLGGFPASVRPLLFALSEMLQMPPRDLAAEVSQAAIVTFGLRES